MRRWAWQAKLRVEAQYVLAVPVVFLMLSNHFPVASYEESVRVGVLLALVVWAGWQRSLSGSYESTRCVRSKGRTECRRPVILQNPGRR